MAEHRFRFFTTETADVGSTVTLSEADARHLQVIRAAADDIFDLVDPGGRVLAARVGEDPGTLTVFGVRAEAGTAAPEVVLYAGVLTGQAWDDLVDGSIQAGVSRIVPVAFTAREGDQLRRRAERIGRVAEAAAKQSKRTFVPRIDDPMPAQNLATEPRGIVLDPAAELHLVDWRPWSPGPHGVLVGGSAGIPKNYVAGLVERGWVTARIGDSVLRSELAAAVSVAFVRARSTE